MRDRGGSAAAHCSQLQEFTAGKFHFEPPFTSFDYLVGAGEEGFRDRKPDSLSLL
jgi:hypothetical protein